MADFMHWLYAGYIKPQTEERDDPDYEMSLSLLDTSLDTTLKAAYARALELHSTHAFLLGLRTGLGLSEALKAQPH